MFLIRSKLSNTAYLFLALYGSLTLQSRSFLKNIESFLCQQKLVNNCSIPSMHAERKITLHSHEHSFTPYPSLSPYLPTDGMIDRETNTLAVHRLEELFFQLCCCVSFWFWREIGFHFTYLCTQSTIQLWCCVSFLVLAGNSFLVLRAYLVYNKVVRLCPFFGCGRKQFSKREHVSTKKSY